MRATQHTIAKLARVSQATVSRVLAGDARVDPEIRRRVLAVVAEENYRPDARARSLRQRRTGLIGLVLKRPVGSVALDPFFAGLTSEILEALSKTEYHLCIDFVTSASSQEAVYDQLLRDRRVDGVILVESEARDERISRLQADHFPFVVIGNPGGSQVWSVDNDNVLAAEIATQHLLDQGYRTIAMIAGPHGLTVSEDRIVGYARAFRRAGGTPTIWHSEFGAEPARAAAREALTSAFKPDALVMLDDFMAMGAVHAARDLGLCVPDHVGLVGFNDSYLCELLECGLTSVSLSVSEIVRLAVDQLLSIVEGRSDEPPFRRVVPCRLCARGSTAPTLARSAS